MFPYYIEEYYVYNNSLGVVVPIHLKVIARVGGVSPDVHTNFPNLGKIIFTLIVLL